MLLGTRLVVGFPNFYSRSLAIMRPVVDPPEGRIHGGHGFA
jgi:hypothetical protein